MKIFDQLRIFWFNLKYRVLFPVYWRGGGRIVRFEPNFTHIRIKLPFYYRTRGFFGTHAGGALYAVVDPIYVFMLASRLGPDYLVWDTAAEIEYKKPAALDLFADFFLSEEDLATVRVECASSKKCLRHFQVELKDKGGTVYCQVQKHIYIRRKSDKLTRRLARAA